MAKVINKKKVASSNGDSSTHTKKTKSSSNGGGGGKKRSAYQKLKTEELKASDPEMSGKDRQEEVRRLWKIDESNPNRE
ncbi:hypothetical protein Rhopal_002549-T1 [Rhodotorula paludigena]|uniref:Uncharacterized protein n=1 Tax=Rhodotorula paludigena TaxID=86838 RepID=A0AAV5GJM1_9BASI|nr:hypothetical protein Rhopal_002549-T1 [Rhodotorula paludigena]